MWTWWGDLLFLSLAFSLAVAGLAVLCFHRSERKGEEADKEHWKGDWRQVWEKADKDLHKMVSRLAAGSWLCLILFFLF